MWCDGGMFVSTISMVNVGRPPSFQPLVKRQVSVWKEKARQSYLPLLLSSIPPSPLSSLLPSLPPSLPPSLSPPLLEMSFFLSTGGNCHHSVLLVIIGGLILIMQNWAWWEVMYSVSCCGSKQTVLCVCMCVCVFVCVQKT